MQIQCYKCKKDFECNPEGKCWCKDLDYKILDKDNSLINVLVDKAFVYYKLNKIKESLDICIALLKKTICSFKLILTICLYCKNITSLSMPVKTR